MRNFILRSFNHAPFPRIRIGRHFPEKSHRFQNCNTNNIYISIVSTVISRLKKIIIPHPNIFLLRNIRNRVQIINNSPFSKDTVITTRFHSNSRTLLANKIKLEIEGGKESRSHSITQLIIPPLSIYLL